MFTLSRRSSRHVGLAGLVAALLAIALGPHLGSKVAATRAGQSHVSSSSGRLHELIIEDDERDDSRHASSGWRLSDPLDVDEGVRELVKRNIAENTDDEGEEEEEEVEDNDDDDDDDEDDSNNNNDAVAGLGQRKEMSKMPADLQGGSSNKLANQQASQQQLHNNNQQQMQHTVPPVGGSQNQQHNSSLLGRWFPAAVNSRILKGFGLGAGGFGLG